MMIYADQNMNRSSKSDAISSLPTDKVLPNRSEVETANQLFTKETSVTDKLLEQGKEASIIFVVVFIISLPQVDSLLTKFIPITNKSPYIAILIKSILATLIIWIIMVDMRSFFFSMMKNKIPVILSRYYNFTDFNQTRIYSSTDLGGLFIQGFGDGIFIKSNNVTDSKIKKLNNLSFKILQAARVRVTSTDFISCPSCGRTLFDLTETTARIRDKTNHLKGLKIGIMGCIVNGPGEMADADYGYVGSGKEKITLYRGKEVVKRSVHFNDGVDELIKLIKEDGNWIEPKH